MLSVDVTICHVKCFAIIQLLYVHIQCNGVHLGSAAGARVVQLIGSDRDRGENTVLTYTLAPLHPNFLLDRVSGILTVSTLGLDYESVTSHSLSAYVEDNGSPNLRVSQFSAF